MEMPDQIFSMEPRKEGKNSKDINNKLKVERLMVVSRGQRIDMVTGFILIFTAFIGNY